MFSKFDPVRLRSEMKAKARRMAGGDPSKKVDASTWKPGALMHTETPTGEMPLPRKFKRGGAVSGSAPASNPGRAARAKGGRIGKDIGGGVDPRQAAMAALANAATKTGVQPNRMGFNPTARSPLIGLKKGGAVAKADGGSANYKGGSNYLGGTRPTGGRIARAKGGRAKGKTNIIISINPQGAGAQAGMPLPSPPMRPPAQPIPVPAPPMGAAPPPPMPMPMPPPGGPPMLPRKSGGRAVYPTIAGAKSASSFKDMDAGACSAMGRLEKTAIAKKKYALAP